MDAKQLGDREVTRQSAGPTALSGQPLYPGLTLRQHFAGLAMGAICYHSDYPNAGPELVAAAAVELADALLAELTKDKT